MRAIRLSVLFLLIALGCAGSAPAQDKPAAPPDRIGTIATAAVTGLVSGVIASLFAPWVHWGIELRRNRLGYRRDVIRFAREDAKADFEREKFVKTYSYSIIRDELLPETVARLHEPAPPPGTAAAAWQEAMRLEMLLEIARIERKWGLV